jgi:spore coat protein U-like protein
MRKFFLLAGVLGAIGSGAANAGTATTTFQVTATMLSKCTATATALAFPNYTPGGGAVAANSTISVKCTKSSPYTVSLNAGATTGDAFTQRLMASGTNYLQYNLYTTAGFTTVFGDGTGATANSGTLTGAGMATANTTTVYGQVPDSTTNQAAVPGTAYADTITVTVTY